MDETIPEKDDLKTIEVPISEEHAEARREIELFGRDTQFHVPDPDDIDAYTKTVPDVLRKMRKWQLEVSLLDMKRRLRKALIKNLDLEREADAVRKLGDAMLQGSEEKYRALHRRSNRAAATAEVLFELLMHDPNELLDDED